MSTNMRTNLRAAIVVTFFAACLIKSQAFDLTILHTNDVHARIEETNKYSGACSADDAKGGNCYGGAARIRTMVNQKRAEYPNTIVLDGGDQFQGTLWFFEFGGLVSAVFMNLIGYDAMAIGNHEFDRGVAGLVPFANNLTFPLLSCNANFSRTPELSGVVKKSTILNVGGERIGVVGYTTDETEYISSPETVTFSQELGAVQSEVDKLVAEGVNKIIALGHSGFATDQMLARNLKGVDVVVGGHTNTFLYSGDTAPSNEEPVGSYPFLVSSIHEGEPDVLVVQDYAYGKYLGELHVTFDDNGKITSHSGNPILLDSSVAKDNETEEVIKSYLPRLNDLKNEVIGQSHVRMPIEGSTCRIGECNLGNFVADAMVHQNVRTSDSKRWSDVGIAVVNSGSLRASLEIGPITVENAIFVQPFRNTVDIVVLTGQTIWDIFEYGATRWTNDPNKAYGGFLQVSGLKIVYDMSRAENERVVQILARCTDCLTPRYEKLDLSKSYKVLMSSFVSGGGDGYSMIEENILDKHILGTLDMDILSNQIRQFSPVITGLEGRIQHLDEMQSSGLYDFLINGASPLSATWFHVAIVLVITLLSHVL